MAKAKVKYETHVKPYLTRIPIWVAKGATNKEVAEKLNVSIQALYKWRSAHVELMEALEVGAGGIDDEVEAALYRRCTGQWVTEEIRWQTIGRNGELMWLTKEHKKYIPADQSSIQFWLTNRRPKEWKRMPDVKLETVEFLSSPNRGGIGSTGEK